jgi:hypothetical protein
MGLRRVSAELFRGAAKFHSGGMVGPGEVPAILKRGEGVFTQAQMAALGPASPVMVQVIDQRGANAPPAEVTETTGPDGQRVIRMLILAETRNAIANGSLDRDMRASYGIARRGA